MTEDERRHSMEKRKRVQQALHDWLVRGKIVAKLKHDQGLQLPKKRNIVSKKICEFVFFILSGLKLMR